MHFVLKMINKNAPFCITFNLVLYAKFFGIEFILQYIYIISREVNSVQIRVLYNL